MHLLVHPRWFIIIKLFEAFGAFGSIGLFVNFVRLLEDDVGASFDSSRIVSDVSHRSKTGVCPSIGPVLPN